MAPPSVDHQGVRLHRRGRVVQRVGVLRRLSLQLTLIVERARAAVAEKPAQDRQPRLKNRLANVSHYVQLKTVQNSSVMLLIKKCFHFPK